MHVGGIAPFAHDSHLFAVCSGDTRSLYAPLTNNSPSAPLTRLHLHRPCQVKQKSGDRVDARIGQNVIAGWFNKLMQYGRSDGETKTCGSHGGVKSQTVNSMWVGNLHPTAAIQCLNGMRGDPGCQALPAVLSVFSQCGRFS